MDSRETWLSCISCSLLKVVNHPCLWDGPTEQYLDEEFDQK